MAAKVSRMRPMYAADEVGDRKRERWGDDGVARIC